MIKNFLTLLALTMICGSTFAQDAPAEKTATALYNEGLAFVKEKQYEAGLPLLLQALEKGEAEENEQVVKLAKKNASVATYKVGTVQRKAGKLDEALATFQKGIEMMPEKPLNHSGVAAVLNKQGKNKEAMLKYLEAVELAQKANKSKQVKQFTKKAGNIVGKCYTGKDYDKAIEFGKEFLAKAKSASVNYYVSRSLGKKESYADALKYAQAAIDLAGDAKQDKYFVAKAKALEGSGDNAGAVEAYKMVTGDKYLKMATQKIEALSGK